MANVDFQTLSKTGFANLFGVERMVPGHSSDLHVHGVIPRLGRVKPTEAGNLICACSACEFYDKRFGTNARMLLNGKRRIEAGKFPALQPPPTYDSGTQWGLPGPDMGFTLRYKSSGTLRSGGVLMGRCAPGSGLNVRSYLVQMRPTVARARLVLLAICRWEMPWRWSLMISNRNSQLRG